MVKDVASRPEPYLFLDPDTGINLKNGSTERVTADQLKQIAERRHDKIVLVFDHAFLDGGKAQEKVEKKLKCLSSTWGLASSAVIVREHRCVCFVWVSTDRKAVEEVTKRLCTGLQLPKPRLVPCPR